MRTAQDIVQTEVLCCLSSLVSTLASAYDDCANKDANTLCKQAQELFAASLDDWEEAAIQAGWKQDQLQENTWSREGTDYTALDCYDACEYDNIEPYPREVFEHWAVTEWFADQLETHGEKVDHDFAGLCVWARTTTGQAIYADDVIEQITANLAKVA